MWLLTNNLAHKPSAGEFFASLDGLRGLAVLSVVIGHTAYFNPDSSHFQRVLLSAVQTGGMRVSIFFVMSGFLISYTVIKSDDCFDPWSYAVRRFAKIYPPFLLSLLTFSILTFFWKNPDHLLASAAANLTTITNFTEGWININGAYWSLMVELHFYIVFPLIYMGFRKLTRNADWATFWFFLLVPATLRFSNYGAILVGEDNMRLWNFQTHLFPRALDNFSLGILFSIILKRWRNDVTLAKMAPKLANTGALLLIATYVLYTILEHFFSITGRPIVIVCEAFNYLPALATFLILFVVLTPSTSALKRFLTSPILGFIGVISYEWFLFHLPPTTFLREILGKSDGSIMIYLLKTLLPFIGTLLLSFIIYRYYSTPIILWTRNMLRRRSQARLKLSVSMEISPKSESGADL